jgi:glycosyltransferase involved in cell wall biosynthesis
MRTSAVEKRGDTDDLVAVIIPCFRVEATIANVLQHIGPEVSFIICVDDASDDDTQSVLQHAASRDSRITVVRRAANGGVGAATIDGYAAGIARGARILVKLDGDGQMDPALIGSLVAPIIDGEADYVKGNRFYSFDTVRRMPAARLLGNAALSFLTKLSTGYWNLFDPTNGFTALESSVAELIPLEKIHRRYFFESDILFRLNAAAARVIELPMTAVYADEKSNMRLTHTLMTFPGLHLRNLGKRIIYNYFLRNFSLASINLVVGVLLVASGCLFGASRWLLSIRSGVPATAGTVMLSGLPILVGVQLVLSFLAYDIAAVPQRAVHRYLIGKGRQRPEMSRRGDRGT